MHISITDLFTHSDTVRLSKRWNFCICPCYWLLYNVVRTCWSLIRSLSNSYLNLFFRTVEQPWLHCLSGARVRVLWYRVLPGTGARVIQVQWEHGPYGKEYYLAQEPGSFRYNENTVSVEQRTTRHRSQDHSGTARVRFLRYGELQGAGARIIQVHFGYGFCGTEWF